MSNAWMVRSNPNGIDRFKEFKEGNVVGLGWNEVESLEGKDLLGIEEMLDEKYDYKSSRSLSSDKANLYVLANRMQKNDLIVLPYGDVVYIGRITTDYIYNKEQVDDKGFPHQRGVEWISNAIPRDELTKDLRASLKVPKACANLTHRYKDIQIALGEVKDDEIERKLEFITVQYPIRPDVNVKIEIPKNLTESESLRLSAFIKTIHFD